MCTSVKLKRSIVVSYRISLLSTKNFDDGHIADNRCHTSELIMNNYLRQNRA